MSSSPGPRQLAPWLIFFLVTLAGTLLAAAPAPEPPPLFVVSPDWEKGASTAPCRSADGVFTFPCRFAAAPNQRSVWDARVALDLRTVAGVTFRFRATDTSSFYRFLVYFKSGTGWYGATVTPRGTGDWENVTAWKSATFIEGKVAGWGAISGVRIAVSPAAPRDASFDLTGFAAARGDSRLMILRATSALDGASSAEARSISDFPDRVARALRRVGINPVFMDDLDFTPALAQKLGTRGLILPYNHLMDEPVARAVAATVEQGCFVLGFHVVPKPLEPLLGLRGGPMVTSTAVKGGVAGLLFRTGAPTGTPPRVPQASWIFQDLRPATGSAAVAIGSWANQDWQPTAYAAVVLAPRGIWMSHVYLDSEPAAGSRMLLALTGQRLPDLWRTAATTAVADLATLDPGDAVRARRQEAEALIAEGRFTAALELVEATRRDAQRAYMDAQQPSRGDEFRGAWCHRGYGISGWSWDRSVRQLRDCGFNALFPNMTWAGVAFYPSRILPAAPIVAEQGDQLKLCADACRRYGVQLHAWIVCFNLGDETPASRRESLQKAGRLQVNSKGTVNPRWICPANPANRRQLQDEVREILRNYSVQGIHLDFIRFPDQEHCYCDECRHQFEALTGRRFGSDWAGEVRKTPALLAKWYDFRRQLITGAVREVRGVIREEKGDVKLSAAVYENPTSARDAVGQDWAAWCRNGYLDFVAPMDYTPESDYFRDTVTQQLAGIQGAAVRLYPGIGARSAHLTPMQTAQQIAVTRRLNTGGFMLFEYNYDEATQLLPELARGVTKD